MVSAVILAAGLSRRMGEKKLTLMLDGYPLVEHVMNNLEVSDIDNIVLVYSEHTKEIKQIADRHGIRSILNEDAQLGLSTSVKKGLSEVSGSKGVMFLLGDQPFIETEDINKLIHHARENKDKIIVPISYEGKGNPIIFPEKYYSEIQTIDGDQGARQVLKKHEDQIVFVEVSKSRIHFDVDTAADYKKANEIVKSR